MRRNGSLLTDNPVVYRVIRSSGYREAGTPGAVDGDHINARARSTSRSSIGRPSSAGGDGGASSIAGGSSRAATLLRDVLAAGDAGEDAAPQMRHVGFADAGDEDAGGSRALELQEQQSGSSRESADGPRTAHKSPGGPQRVPVSGTSRDDSGPSDSQVTRRMKDELQALKARVGTMQTLAERTAAVLAPMR